MTTRTIIVDGISIVTTDQGAQVIEKKQVEINKLTGDASAHVAVVQAKDNEIGELKVKLQKALDAVPTGAALDKMVADRTSLIADARALSKDLAFEGLSDSQIRKAAVAAVYGDDLVKDASDAEIAGMFRAATIDSVKKSADPLQKALAKDGVKPQIGDNGQAQYEKRLADAWKGAPAT